jgi:hypothetical protein
MTTEGKMYAGGAVVILAMVLLLLWSVLLWVALGLLAITLVVVGWLVWGAVHRRRIESRKAVAEAIKMEAEAEQAQAIAEERRASAALKRAEVAAKQAQQNLIPEGYIGAMLRSPEERDLYFPWTYKQEVSPAVARMEQQETVVQEVPTPALPGPTDLSYILGTFQPSPAQILLGLTERGYLTCSLEGVSHVALAAPTGGGKSSIMRLLLAQILACQAMVWLADPHYTPVDPKSGEDWRMIAARLAKPPFTDAHIIKDLLAWLVQEMKRRYALREAGKRWGAPCYLAIDEWPAILSELDKQEQAEVVTLTGKLLRQGRKVDVHLITSSQDFLVETIGSGGEIRSNLRTAYFAGGGLATARALLDQQIKLPETPLGKGVVLLRSEEAQPTPGLTRVPYPSNEALYRLLPMARQAEEEIPPLPSLPLRRQTAAEEGESTRAAAEQDSPDSSVPVPNFSTPNVTKLERLGGWERKFIAQRYRAGEERTAIRDQLRELRGGFSNKLWGELKAICDAIDGEEAGA